MRCRNLLRRRPGSTICTGKRRRLRNWVQGIWLTERKRRVATNNQQASPEEAEKRRNFLTKLFQSLVNSSNRPKNMRELGISALKNLPSNITMVRSFMKAVNWKEAQGEVLQGLNHTIV